MTGRFRLSALSAVIMLSFSFTAFAGLSLRARTLLDQLRTESAEKGWTFTVGPSPVLDETEREWGGFIPNLTERENALYVRPAFKGELPKQYDWRTLTKFFPPIKDQGQCGSCWAFATVATLESVLAIKENLVTPRSLSEQYLVSCNKDGWGCMGGYFAHQYHQDPGAVQADRFVYSASDVSCPENLDHGPKIASWGHVGTNSHRSPTADELKKAIIEYGPLAVSFAVKSSFTAYTSGVYNDCDGDMDVNHAMNLVGWNDKDGAWIVRNSWGTGWGEKGYSRIKYGCDKIAEDATFVRYNPGCNPQPIADVGHDVTIRKGEKAKIGSASLAGHKYQWNPATGLSDATSAMPMASPNQTTEYTLTDVTACGDSHRKVKVTVTP